MSRRLTYLRHIDARVEDGGCSSGRGRYKVAVQHVQRMIPGHRDRADRCDYVCARGMDIIIRSYTCSYELVLRHKEVNA